MACDSVDTLPDHERLVQALLRAPGVLDAPAGERQLVQTHISSVLLAGARAYKLRKPLRLPFLDFSTVAKRRADCDEELRLNRRTAAPLYLEVRALGGSLDEPRWVAPDGPAQDWVLVMKRFDDGLRLDRLADAGRLDGPLVDALAVGLAAFQAGVPPSPEPYGHAPDVRRWALENFEELQPHPRLAPYRDRLLALRQWTETGWARLAGTLEQRRRQGFVREGHGDLHLGNLVLLDGQPVAFDAIEFNPALRHIDTVADIAFTFMDLQRHGLIGLAWRFVAAWADAAGDHAGLVLLGFFAVYRALVRAKVAMLRAGPAGPEGGGHARAEADAALARDLALAARLAGLDAPPRAPRLVLTCGLSGAGKSTVAAHLVEAFGAPRLRSDVERKRLHGLAAVARPTAAQRELLYAPPATRCTFDHLASLAGTLLSAGLDTIVDAAFLRRAERERFRATARAAGASFSLVVCTAPEAELRRRLRERSRRGDDPSDADEAVLDLQLRWQQPPGPDEMAEILDTDTDPATLRRRCEALARHWREAH